MIMPSPVLMERSGIKMLQYVTVSGKAWRWYPDDFYDIPQKSR
jgi:hypothetical protein